MVQSGPRGLACGRGAAALRSGWRPAQHSLGVTADGTGAGQEDPALHSQTHPRTPSHTQRAPNAQPHPAPPPPHPTLHHQEQAKHQHPFPLARLPVWRARPVVRGGSALRGCLPCALLMPRKRQRCWRRRLLCSRSRPHPPSTPLPPGRRCRCPSSCALPTAVLAGLAPPPAPFWPPGSLCTDRCR